MALTNQPYIPFYVGDWLSNNKLKLCSATAHGIMINIMCIMHKEENYGTILLKQKFKQTDKQIKNFALMLAKLLPFDLLEIETGLSELIEEKILKTDNDILFCNRMIKDASVSESRASSGKEGGLKTQKKNRKFAKAKPKANNEDVIENEDENKGKDEKEKYSEFVSLKKSEHEKLITGHGELNTKKFIEALNNYKASSGKKYKSDYHAILNWVIEKVKGADKPVKNLALDESIE